MAEGNSRLVGIYLSDRGKTLLEKLLPGFPELELFEYKRASIPDLWKTARAIIFVSASGIAVRAIAKLVSDKKHDPAVIVLDEAGRYCISLLGGHEAGGNTLAKEISDIVGATAVITTATDASGLTPIDSFAKDNGLLIENRELLSSTSALHLREGRLSVFSDIDIKLPDDYAQADSPNEADAIISHKLYERECLNLRPLNIVLGIGLNTGTKADEIEKAVVKLFNEKGLSVLSLGMISTHEKKTSEPGLKEFANARGLKIISFTTEELNKVEAVSESPAAMKALGVKAVAEPSAILASSSGGGGGTLISKKVKSGNLTLAVALLSSWGHKLYVIGTGPGGLEHITPKAASAIRQSDAIVGYKPYLKMIEPLIAGKEIISSGMTEEVGRAKAAIEEALKGKKAAVISGGDPGIYAMAGLVFEVADAMKAAIEIEVIPGLTALNACASILGAPLMHDFASISLSDRLTPWGVIEERLDASARADFVIVLYNPKSRGRAGHIEKARDIIIRHRAPETPVGIVRAATRPGAEDSVVTTLAGMLSHEMDMQTTVIIGNSKTRRIMGRMVTPRGYGEKYEY